jgi:hypothetical protein
MTKRRLIVAPEATVNAWSVEDRAAVKSWAKGGAASPKASRTAPGHPRHGARRRRLHDIGSRARRDVPKLRECGARLLSYPTGSDNGESFEPYPAGTLVGVDCPGAKEPARYAKRGKKKP